MNPGQTDSINQPTPRKDERKTAGQSSTETLPTKALKMIINRPIPIDKINQDQRYIYMYLIISE